MKEQEIICIITDLWYCFKDDIEKFKIYLSNKGLSENEISNYLEMIKKLTFDV